MNVWTIISNVPYQYIKTVYQYIMFRIRHPVEEKDEKTSDLSTIIEAEYESSSSSEENNRYDYNNFA